MRLSSVSEEAPAAVGLIADGATGAAPLGFELGDRLLLLLFLVGVDFVAIRGGTSNTMVGTALYLFSLTCPSGGLTHCTV